MSKRSSCRLYSALLQLVLMSMIHWEAGAQSVPQLAAQRSGTNRVQVEWSAGTNLSILEELLEFSATNDWQDVPDAPRPFSARITPC